jgi:hypothetical protein
MCYFSVLRTCSYDKRTCLYCSRLLCIARSDDTSSVKSFAKTNAFELIEFWLFPPLGIRYRPSELLPGVMWWFAVLYRSNGPGGSLCGLSFELKRLLKNFQMLCFDFLSNDSTLQWEEGEKNN